MGVIPFSNVDLSPSYVSLQPTSFFLKAYYTLLVLLLETIARAYGKRPRSIEPSEHWD